MSTEGDETDGSYRVSNSHKRAKLGVEKYYNAVTMSDITIRYGEYGERVFYGHKIVLSSKSYWFEVAFTGQFEESKSKEIELHEDDPTALEAMFYYLYHDEIQMTELFLESSNSKNAIDTTHLCLEIYKVAEKYDCPGLQSRAEGFFQKGLYWYLRLEGQRKSSDCTGSQYDEFHAVVSKAYELAGAVKVQRKHPLVARILQGAVTSWPTKVIGQPGPLHSVLIKTAEEIAEFGRDVLLNLMEGVGTRDGTGRPSQLVYMGDVICPECDEKNLRFWDEEVGLCESCEFRVDWIKEGYWEKKGSDQ